jgi:GDSL-like Lipase/Acylhydrolase family
VLFVGGIKEGLLVKLFIKRLLLIPFGAGIGLLLAALLLFAWRAVRPEPMAVTKEDFPAVRWLLERDPRGLYQFDEDLNYRPKPNFIGVRQNAPRCPHQTNSLGMLGADEVNASAEVQKILFLGDSVAYGDGVCFDMVFTERIRAQAGKGFQLLNASCCGWSMTQELKYFSKYVSHLHWDLLVLVVCLNDAINYDWVWDPNGHLTMKDHWPLKGLRLLDDPEGQKIKTALLREKFRFDATTTALAQQDSSLLAAWMEGQWETHLGTVLKPFVESASRPPLALVVIPTRQQLTAHKAGGAYEAVFAPQQTLAQFCERHKVPYLDAAKEFLSDPLVDEKTVFRDSTHLSEDGHQRIAGPIWQFLQKQLPASAPSNPSPTAAAQPTRARR